MFSLARVQHTLRHRHGGERGQGVRVEEAEQRFRQFRKLII
jgi:hypothetical protein